MLITKETDYALRILRSLSGGTQISSNEICSQELVPQQFAYKILRKLSKANLIKSTRGPDGGSILTADLKQVSLYDLMGILEGNEYLSSCTEPGFQCNWRTHHNQDCSVHSHLMTIQEKLDQELQKHSIHQILFGELS